MGQTIFHDDFLRSHPEFREFLHIVRFEIQNAQRPASEIILIDEDVMKKLKISKRKLQYLKSKKQITYSTVGAQSIYLLSDVLELVNENKREKISKTF